jgi:uncharacterized C2H2 Zn-finger protein
MTRTNAYYCDICDAVTPHVKISFDQYQREAAVSGFGKVYSRIFQYSGLGTLYEGAASIAGKQIYKCQKCCAVFKPESDEIHWYNYDAIIYTLDDLRSNKDVLKKIRKKYNPKLLADKE